VCVYACVLNSLSRAKSSGLLWLVLQAAALTGQRAVVYSLETERTKKIIQRVGRDMK
jgi:hypothetical protein